MSLIAVKELSRLKSLIVKLEKDLISLGKEVQSLQKEARENDEDAKTLYPKMKSAVSEYDSFDVTWEYRRQLNHDFEYNRAVSDLRDAESDLRSAESDLRSAEWKLQSCNSKPDAQCSSEKREVDNAERDVREAKSDIDDAKDDIEDAEDDVMNEVKSEKNKLEQEADSLTHRYNYARNRANECRERISEIQKLVLPKTKDQIVNSNEALPLAEQNLVSKSLVTAEKQIAFDEFKTANAYDLLLAVLTDAQNALMKMNQNIVQAENQMEKLPAHILSLEKKLVPLAPKMTKSEGVYLQAKLKYDTIHSQTVVNSEKLILTKEALVSTNELLMNAKLKVQGIEKVVFSYE
jgi:putative ABC transport system permease protein